MTALVIKVPPKIFRPPQIFFTLLDMKIRF